MKIVQFEKRRTAEQQEVQDDIVRILKNWLASAQKGELASIAICGIHESGDAQTDMSMTLNFPATTGAITILQNRSLTRAATYEVKQTDENPPEDGA